MVLRRTCIVRGQAASTDEQCYPDQTTMGPVQLDFTVGAEIRNYTVQIKEDLKDLEAYFNISLSKDGIQKIGEYVTERLNELATRFYARTFASDNQEAKVDFVQLGAWLEQRSEELSTQWLQLSQLLPLTGDWTCGIIQLCEKRQAGMPVDGKYAGDKLSNAALTIKQNIAFIQNGNFGWKNGKFAAYRAARQLEELRNSILEWYHFYAGYDPLFEWWTKAPCSELCEILLSYVAVIRIHLVGIARGQEDTIVGQPIGREGILAALQSEFIAYSPEELIVISEKQYRWCEAEAIKASQEMGFGSNWRAALEKVKTMYVGPGQQIRLVRELAEEAIDYVQKHDMVTIPEVALKWRTSMMSPARQKVAPFFLGGESIIVSYPTDAMAHWDKLMVMRGNSRPFSRSTVFHELIPGHHLQEHYMARYKIHRQLFNTPFWIEGWAFYWELILWDKGFAETPEDKLGMLFWHMHRCIRIVFSLNFHLGIWNPQQCVDALVNRVGHERATAEGEVRRSFNGDYGPLYQAGYMLGALQFYQLRKEMVDSGRMSEKSFHDFILKENTMPIELLRALMKNEKLDGWYAARWRFYDLDNEKIVCGK